MTQYKGQGLVQLTGRNSNYWFNPINGHIMCAPPKIKWKRLPGFKLQAYVDEIGPRGFERGLRESDLEPIQEWSTKTGCGVRTSFNMWKFKKPEDMTAFMLKWS